MSIFEAIFLGVVQGVTEVLPISSSGHLVLVPWFFRFSDPGLSFNVALHLGTLAAIMYYFRTDWLNVIKDFFSFFKGKREPRSQLSLYIIIATIPGSAAGVLFEKYAESSFRSPLLVAFTTAIFGFIMIFAERKGSQKSEVKDLTGKNAFKIGLAQAVAIIPGVSRSGITISAGLFQGFTREAAARFSFLISAPIIFGAGLFEAKDIFNDSFSVSVFTVGFMSSLLASFLSVKLLMSFVKNHKLNIFAYYRFGLATLIILFYLVR